MANKNPSVVVQGNVYGGQAAGQIKVTEGQYREGRAKF